MKRSIVIILGCLVLLLVGKQAVAIPSVLDVVSDVNQTTYRNYLDNMLYTHLGNNRDADSGAEHDLARDNIYTEFDRFGLAASYASFQYNGNTSWNVIGIHQGKVRPGDIYIIGAHYDSFGNPGADDNGSGTAGVLEAARVLSGYDFEATLIFIAFDREEDNLLGSKAYAQEHAGDNILGMLSLDMIAYNFEGTNTARIYGNDNSAPFKDGLANAISTYGNGLSGSVWGTLNASDHASFEEQGFKAALLIEYGVWNNPYYHHPEDSVDTLNYIDYAYATNMVSSTVGFFATNAVLIPEPATAFIIVIGAVFLGLRRKQS
jgi:hypothetical protein